MYLVEWSEKTESLNRNIAYTVWS